MQIVDCRFIATPGQSFLVTASGVVDIAAGDGPYAVDPNGVLQSNCCLTGPSFSHFNTYSVSFNPNAGSANLPTGIGVLAPSAPWGALVGGWSTVATPMSLTDFFGGAFTLVGSSSSITAPNAAGYQLFLGINECLGCPNDNEGSFVADVVPEPASIVLLGTGLAGLVRAHRRRENKALVKA